MNFFIDYQNFEFSVHTRNQSLPETNPHFNGFGMLLKKQYSFLTQCC